MVYVKMVNTAISREVVGKTARDNPERYCAWFCIHCFSKKFERMAREAMDIFLRVLKESNKSSFDSFSVRNNVLIISHSYLLGLSRAHFFPTTFLEMAVCNKVQTTITCWKTRIQASLMNHWSKKGFNTTLKAMVGEITNIYNLK